MGNFELATWIQCSHRTWKFSHKNTYLWQNSFNNTILNSDNDDILMVRFSA